MDYKAKECIEKLIVEIGKCRRLILEKGEARAKAIKEYDKKLAIALATLRMDENYTLGGRQYKSPPVSIMEKIAKGICADEKEKLEIAESDYTATVKNLQALMAQLNGYQSIYRYSE